ncbi:MAG TPA: hypothetical protein PKI80_04560 [Deltaproteobacteria bacterium]|jgi:hypothetical protein|nr:hypothetical protein [Pseudomonadota bacterium]HNR50833.1 hypothetical protein [Deltaproteobacteria bacterium]HRR21134.1 hypothetical protein [Desulfomonilia bacterium]HOE71503.1 hypothetical protein [Deltaproteobacteria bacterium]HON60706.1 hypothetical protein [Deltaproteobacteria bacterium]
MKPRIGMVTLGVRGLAKVVRFYEKGLAFPVRTHHPKSLQYVVWPVLSFVPVDPGVFDSEWAQGKVYDLRLYLFGVVTLGCHTIRIVTIDRRANMIVSRESGSLARLESHDPARPGRKQRTVLHGQDRDMSGAADPGIPTVRASILPTPSETLEVAPEEGRVAEARQGRRI